MSDGGGRLRVHAICLALNEEPFIEAQLRTLYPFCNGISVLTQYDRDWYGKPVAPDRTLGIVANFPDPEGKVHLVLRRWRDQAAGLNSEIGALSRDPSKGVGSHGTPEEDMRRFHAPPDYFLVVDADEFYDIETVGAAIEHLAAKRPRGMRVHAYNYMKKWNLRVPMNVVRFCQFGFVRRGVMFEHIREVTWNEPRLQKALRLLRLPDFSARAFGFIECPREVAVFHHGCWLGNRSRLLAKASKSAHVWSHETDYEQELSRLETEYVPTDRLPRNIREAAWPPGFLD